MSKTSSAVKDRYNAKAYDQIIIRVPKGGKDILKRQAEAENLSLAAYLTRGKLQNQ